MVNVTFPAQSSSGNESNQHEAPLLFGDNGQTNKQTRCVSLSCQHLGNVKFLFKNWNNLQFFDFMSQFLSASMCNYASL